MAAEVALQEKRCSRCGETKPIERFQMKRTKAGELRPTHCRRCHTNYAIQWREKNPDKYRASKVRQTRRIRARIRLMRASVEPEKPVDPEKLDIVRRALAENPPELIGETDTLAYFRGFMAGCKHFSGESHKLEAVRDLIHRIAAEEHRKRGRWLPYEDAISTAYGAVLNLIRSKTCPDAPFEFRRVTAIAIRRDCIDFVRAAIGRHGQRLQLDQGFQEDEEGGLAASLAAPETAGLPGAIGEALGGLPRLKDRDLRILELVSQGLPTKRVGELVGLTESRICQILKRVREVHPELEQRLLGA